MGKFALSTEVYDVLKDKENKRRDIETNKAQKLFDAHFFLLAEVHKVMELYKPSHLLTVPELRVPVKWYSRDGDGKLPAKKEDMLQQYEATKNSGGHVPPLPHPPGGDHMPLPATW
jgi:hypothetical protein